MSGIDIFAILVLTVIIASVVYVFVFLGLLPGKIARTRNHPHAEAIGIGSWLGLLFGGVLWAVILVWAYTAPKEIPVGNGTGDSDDQAEKIARLEERLVALETRLQEGQS